MSVFSKQTSKYTVHLKDVRDTGGGGGVTGIGDGEWITGSGVH